MGRQHVSSGVMIGALVAYAVRLPPEQATAFIAITAVSSLIPDMDHPGAMLPRMLSWPGRMLAAITNAIFGHRTLTHSVLGIGLLSAGMAFIPRLPSHCYWAVILGCFVHVLGDMLTVSGVPLFWPRGRCYRIGWMRAGGQFEQLVMTPLLVIGAALSVGLVVATSA